MKRVVSVSLGSARRDHKVQVELLGESFEIARRGTDGDFEKAVELLKELDGKVDAIGLGGIDVFLWVRQKRFAIQDGLKLMEAVKITPVVDGSGLKNTLEREVVRILARETNLIKKGTKVLMVSSVDRFGMAEAMSELGCDVTFGDLIFAAGIPYPIKTVEELEELANKLLPEITKMPFHMIYPTGKKQESQDEAKVQKFAGYYQDAEVIAGDFHLIRRFMPSGLKGQTILTNTTTPDDVAFLKEKGVGTLVTTTPVYEGRSFGTNVMEAALVAILGKPWAEITPEEYLGLLEKLNFRPQILNLQ
ncbi:MAG TPA: quinate 5-dehydrogenase [Bacillota bacterium]|nr:quinate 5-dehydrogenase [Peptococcaceae bacterium MAG4]NLW38712.1 quinate 5-dehydrogenase [Peptococcaceae bacterium]HPZ44059.1 quinate 5-dehydrogenase [Bacillota bacterium]HQD75192.1 quinate 5-dehydrogenase [Bacillota bacterium]HUM58006.1 quinate 5-dehydrogenase [Bacillota bacterium]